MFNSKGITMRFWDKNKKTDKKVEQEEQKDFCPGEIIIQVEDPEHKENYTVNIVIDLNEGICFFKTVLEYPNKEPDDIRRYISMMLQIPENDNNHHTLYINEKKRRVIEDAVNKLENAVPNEPQYQSLLPKARDAVIALLNNTLIDSKKSYQESLEHIQRRSDEKTPPNLK